MKWRETDKLDSFVRTVEELASSLHYRTQDLKNRSFKARKVLMLLDRRTRFGDHLLNFVIGLVTLFGRFERYLRVLY